VKILNATLMLCFLSLLVGCQTTQMARQDEAKRLMSHSAFPAVLESPEPVRQWAKEALTIINNLQSELVKSEINK
jgi:hypothetical protein